jgi:voltage-gated potassium channel
MGIPSWPLASLVVSGVYYLSFLVAAYLDGFATMALTSLDGWRISLIPPTILLYSLLVVPVLRQQLTRSIGVFRAMVPLNDSFRRLEEEAFSLKRRREWVAVGLGSLIGWLFLRPPWDLSHFSAMIYDVLGDVLIFGFAGWHIYAALSRTKLLTKMHGQAQRLNLFKQPAPFRPIAEWIMTLMAILVGGVVLTAALIPKENLLNPTSIIVASTLALATVLVFLFSRMPASILSQLRVLRALVLFAAVATVGTIGFSQLEEWTFSESLYATVITMTTIGFGDFVPTSDSSRLFTVLLSLFAIGIGGYAITSIASFVIEGNFHQFIQGRKVDKQIVRMHDHYIVCGAGRVGKQIAVEFYKTHVPFVVVERNPEVLEELLRELETPFIQGDATQDETLGLAGIERAKGLIAALSDDKDNVYIVLSARSMSPQLRIISRMQHEKNRRKLEKAGADTLISPNAVSGRRMVSEMLYSEVVTLLDEMLRAEQQTGQTLRLEELHIGEIRVPQLIEQLEQGKLTISDIGQRTSLMVVAIKRQTQEPAKDPYIYTPRGTTKLQLDDVLIVIATPDQRVKLYEEVLSQDSFGAWVSRLLG